MSVLTGPSGGDENEHLKLQVLATLAVLNVAITNKDGMCA